MRGRIAPGNGRAVRAAVLAAALSLALPSFANACAVCGLFTDERSRRAIFGATIFMSLLPLAAIAAGLAWLARRAGAALREEFRESDEAAPAADPVAEPPKS